MKGLYPEASVPLRVILEKLTLLYGEQQAQLIFESLQDILKAFNGNVPHSLHDTPRTLSLTEKDALLIAYGDHIQDNAQVPLQTMHSLAEKYLKNIVTGIHFLPFFPYTSDDGFSVVDYLAIDPALGTWGDVSAFTPNFKLMFDLVINHISQKSAWFQAYLRDEAPYNEYFIAVDPATDLSLVTRPRALPLLSPFETLSGTKHVWTTFSDDQIDLNYENPHLLLEMLKVLLFYVEQGADLIRLDAIAFLWKQIGTTSIHLEQTHAVVQLMRAVLDVVAPNVTIITETNVPHDENISYFGDGYSEAQMVYQFALPPLVLHTFRTGDATALTEWAKTIQAPSNRASYFNFLASHDGIGIRPVTGILNAEEINVLVQLTTDHGGLVSYKHNSDGSQSPYELNITYFDAITHPSVTNQDPTTAIKRFLCSQSIMLSLVGMPGIYFSSLFGSRNWVEGVKQTGRNRTINREKLNLTQLSAELAQPDSLRARVFNGYKDLLKRRGSSAAFHPLGKQRILDTGSTIFAVERVSPDGEQRALVLHNVSEQVATVNLPEATYTLQPYAYLWMIEQ